MSESNRVLATATVEEIWEQHAARAARQKVVVGGLIASALLLAVCCAIPAPARSGPPGVLAKRMARIVSAAPAASFELALEILCPPCSQLLASLDRTLASLDVDAGVAAR